MQCFPRRQRDLVSYQTGTKSQAQEGLQNVPWIVRKKVWIYILIFQLQAVLLPIQSSQFQLILARVKKKRWGYRKRLELRERMNSRGGKRTRIPYSRLMILQGIFLNFSHYI